MRHEETYKPDRVDYSLCNHSRDVDSRMRFISHFSVLLKDRNGTGTNVAFSEKALLLHSVDSVVEEVFKRFLF